MNINPETPCYTPKEDWKQIYMSAESFNMIELINLGLWFPLDGIGDLIISYFSFNKKWIEGEP